MNLPLTAAIVRSYLDHELDQAFAAFKGVPGGERWRRLENAMYAYQWAKIKKDADVAFLSEIGIGYWVGEINKLVPRQ